MTKLFSQKNSLLHNFFEFRNVRIFFYIVIFLFWLWIGSQAPYTNDDWDWGLPMGMEWLIEGSVNSRYAGNLAIVLMTRSRLVKTLFFAIFSFAVPYLISVIPNVKDRKYSFFLFLLSNLLLMFMSRHVWQQSYGWLAAFANYVISGACVVWLYSAEKRALDGEQFTKIQLVVSFLVSFAAQLFIENLTVFFLGVSLLALTVCIIMKKSLAGIISIVVGVILGTVLMFSSPVYGQLLDTGNSLNRELAVWGAKDFASVFEHIWFSVCYHLPGMYEVNTYICIAVLISISGVLFLYNKHWLSRLCLVCNFILAILFVAFKLDKLPAFFFDAGGNTFLSWIYFLLMIFETASLGPISGDREFSVTQLFVWSSTFFVIVPLFVTANSGFRLYYAVVVISIIYISENIIFVAGKTRITQRGYDISMAVVSIMLVFTSFYYANVYRNIGQVDREQRKIISEAIAAGEDTIYLPSYNQVQKSFMWGPMAITETRIDSFKQFYGINSSAQIIYFEE